jgi:hypothetical protein
MKTKTGAVAEELKYAPVLQVITVDKEVETIHSEPANVTFTFVLSVLH